MIAALVVLSTVNLKAQKVGFISSDVIRKYFLESQQAEQRIQSLVDEWKRELDGIKLDIEKLEYEIQKNRLVWSDSERLEKERELEQKKNHRLGIAKAKFEPGGEYDKVVKSIMQPVEGKIFAAVQQVSNDEGFDIILDQSKHPMPYLNFKYDLTVKVLRKLGVNVDELEKELQEKIDIDPRNKKKESYEPRKRSRGRRLNPDSNDREIEREDEGVEEDVPEEQGLKKIK